MISKKKANDYSLSSLHKVEWQSFDSHWHGKCRKYGQFRKIGISFLLESWNLWKICKIYNIWNEIFDEPEGRKFESCPRNQRFLKPRNHNGYEVLLFLTIYSVWKNDSLFVVKMTVKWLSKSWFLKCMKLINADFNMVIRFVEYRSPVTSKLWARAVTDFIVIII